MGAADSERTVIAAPEGPGPPTLPREGDEVGSYRLEKLLGTGGMGSVFLAEHHAIGRRVAIKFLLPELAKYPDIVGRFFDEARSVNRINHENIVEIFDFVRSPSGLSYLVMELLDGTDLYQTRKRDGPYPLARTLPICEQIAFALAAAHKVGIIHRDLKPENVFLVRRRNHGDFVKLLDFGLAKLSEDMPISRQPTQAGIVMGTPGYMSPEQAKGVPIDGRSDVFSLGILMHWLIADRVPDDGPNSRIPEQNVLGEDLPEPMRKLLSACIQLDPLQRPAGMEPVLESLTQLRRQVRGTEVLRVVQPVASSPTTPEPEPSAHSLTDPAGQRADTAETVLVQRPGLRERKPEPAPKPAAPAQPERSFWDRWPTLARLNRKSPWLERGLWLASGLALVGLLLGGLGLAVSLRRPSPGVALVTGSGATVDLPQLPAPPAAPPIPDATSGDGTDAPPHHPHHGKTKHPRH